MSFKRWLLCSWAALCVSISPAFGASRNDAEAAMKRATRFMVEKVSYRGGYLWNYLPDMSRRWGEMEARPTMIWLQPPGTSSMGHEFLDAPRRPARLTSTTTRQPSRSARRS